jgi:hypothetical protein
MQMDDRRTGLPAIVRGLNDFVGSDGHIGIGFLAVKSSSQSRSDDQFIQFTILLAN